MTSILDNEQLEKHLKNYLTGRLDKIIKKIKRKVNKNYSDECYNTLGNGGGKDPTGDRATFIADMRRYNELDYQHYKNIKKAVLEAIKGFDEVDLIILQYRLRLKKGGYIKASKEAGINQNKARSLQKKVINKLNNYDWPLQE